MVYVVLNNIGLLGWNLIGVVIYTTSMPTKFRFKSKKGYKRRSTAKSPCLATPKSNQCTTIDSAPIVGKCDVVDYHMNRIGKKKIRFAGINALELGEPYGTQAK